MAPMMSPPSARPRCPDSCRSSLRRLTSRVGRNTPAFIISISAVPPAIGRTVASSGSSSAIASRSEVGSTSSNGVMCESRDDESSRGRRGKGRAHPLGELPFHLLGLGAQHRLAEAAELAGQRGVDLIAHLGSPVVCRQPGHRAGGQAPDDSERRAFDLGLDLVAADQCASPRPRP